MAPSKDQQEFHFYVQCHEAVQLVCAQAVLPCVENVIKEWHATKQVVLHTTNQQVNLQPCMSQCPSSVEKNKRRRQPSHCPVEPPLCPNCIQWCHAIESMYWTNDQLKHRAPVIWANINPPKLFYDSIEFAKAFAVSLPSGRRPTSFSDFDPACQLMMMTKFGKCHGNFSANHDAIEKVDADEIFVFVFILLVFSGVTTGCIFPIGHGVVLP